MQFYVSAETFGSTKYPDFCGFLGKCGHSVTYDWAAQTLLENEDHNLVRESAKLRIEGVKEADALILLLPGDLESHAELGIALAFGKPVLIIYDQLSFLMKRRRMHTYHAHPLVTLQRNFWIEDWEKWIRETFPQSP